MAGIKIDLSPIRLTPDALVVWHEPGEQVQLVADPRQLQFGVSSVERIIANHVLDHMFINEGEKALKEWHAFLMPGGRLFSLTDDFEYVVRGFVGGDIDIDTFNRLHTHASQWDRELVGRVMIQAGFSEPKVKIWFDSIKDLIQRKHYELLIEAQK